MHFTLKKAPFLSALEKAGATVSSKDNEPLLKTFNVEADDADDRNEVRFLSTDQTLGSIAKVGVVEIHEAGAICVPADKLRAIVRAAEDGDIDFKVDESQATIKAGRAKWVVNVLDADDFPGVPVFNPDNSEEVSREKLLDVINKVRYAASTESVRPSLMLIAFDGNRAATSDGGRLQVADFKGLKGVQVPIFSVNNLVRLLNRTEVETIRVENQKNHLLFQIGADTFATQRMYDEFPDVESMILKPTESNAEELTVDKSSIVAAVERVRLAADDDRKQLDIEVLEAPNGNGDAPDQVQVSAMDTHGENATETIPCTTTLEAGRKILVNHVYFTDMLAMANSSQVTFKLGPDGRARRSPIRLDEPGLKSVLLQLRPEE